MDTINISQKFGQASFLPEGWFWLLQSSDLPKKAVKGVNFYGHEIVLYRGEDGVVRGVDAYCRHMGAHLADGKVDGNGIRCFFHHWKYAADGRCVDIPCQKTVPPRSLKTYQVRERYGLVWVWTGQEVTADVPVIPELRGVKLDTQLGTPFEKKCHPNVMMINAIDAQHFTSVHELVVDLHMKPTVLAANCIQFSNTTPLPEKNFFLRAVSRFYEKALTYEMTYWYGHNGSVMVGPDFLHFYIIFALRPTLDGRAEGQTILLTRHRGVFFGQLFNRVILFATKLVGNYFAKGDTKVFEKIKFNYATPIAADHAIIAFMRHYEQQSAATVWGGGDHVSGGTQPMRDAVAPTETTGGYARSQDASAQQPLPV